MLVGCDRNHKQRKQRGFTIIEVALVLAIAGLIFLVVFLALPALQNSQKDTARRQAVGQIISALETYEADNQGTWTTAGAKLPSGYYSTLPDNITVDSHSAATLPLPTTTTMEVIFGTKCRPSSQLNGTQALAGMLDGAQGSTDTETGQPVDFATSVAAIIRLSTGSYYCKDI